VNLRLKSTKLDKYLAILQLLSHGPLLAEEIEDRADIERSELRNALDFLIEQNVIEKTPCGNSQTYKASMLGTRVVKYFSLNTMTQ
jgi:DNA-binding IclR family transcriptional regulator